MVKLFLEQLPFLEMLESHRVKKEQHKAILQYATRAQVTIIQEFFKNIRCKNIIPTKSHLKALKKEKNIIIGIIESTDNLQKIRTVLVNNTALIVSMIRHILPYLKKQKKFKEALIKRING